MRITYRLAAAAAFSAITAASLSACGKDAADPQPAPESAATATTTNAATTTTTATAMPTSSTRATSSAAASASAEESGTRAAGSSTEPSASRTDAPAEFNASVDEAYAIFGSLVPKDIFARFDRCDPNGVKDSYNCSGAEVGQFQFFKNKSKASQTTQVLTELRSSRVLSDDGDRVVGWSMLGNTAILTVVDNREGLVMQQMMSTDQDDPEDRLTELGLVR